MRVMVRRDDAWLQLDIDDTQKLRELAFGPELVWIRATGSTPRQFEELGKVFGLHPLALEDVQSPRQRPKVESYDGITFTVVRAPQRAGQNTQWLQTGIFLGQDFVLTASSGPNEILHAAERRLADTGTGITRADHLFHQLLDALVDAYFPFLAVLQDELEELEDEVLDRADRHTLARIRNIKHEISLTRRAAVPMREAMLTLERGGHAQIGAETRTYLRDVADHMTRITEQLEHVKEVALIAQETWNSTLANQQNETMKRLTVVAAVLLLPGLAAGLGGMNFERGFPDWSYWTVVAAITSTILLLIAFAAWRRWL